MTPSGDSPRLRQSSRSKVDLSSANSRWRKLHELDWPGRLDLAMAWLALIRAWIGLRVLGLRWLRRAARKSARAGVSDPKALVRAQELAGIVRAAAARTPVPAGCLERSLVLRKMLSRRGIDSRLRIGVRKSSGSIEAHAWVECGEVSLEPGHPTSEFEPFEELI